VEIRNSDPSKQEGGSKESPSVHWLTMLWKNSQPIWRPLVSVGVHEDG